jgi:NTE family protein
MPAKTPVTFGLALGGGGARGAAHIGVLRVLEREGIPLGPIAGTSIGGVVAVLYAAGHTPDQIGTLMSQLDPDLLKLDPERRALFSLERIRPRLEEVLGEVRLEQLARPCAVVAVDVDHGEEVIITTGPAVEAILATGAVPGLFPPVRLLGRVLVDGGILNPVPVNAVRQLGATEIIAVNINSNRSRPHTEIGGVVALPALGGGKPLMELFPWRDAIRLYSKASMITTIELAERRLAMEQPTIIIRPAVGDVGILDTETIPAGIMAGEAATLAALPQIKARLQRRRRLL